MTNQLELEIFSGFGKEWKDAVALAYHPEDAEGEFGPQRTFVIKFTENVGRVVKEIPHPIWESWLSNNGKAYCASNNGKIYTYCNQEWRREKICDEEVNFDHIWGISGNTSKEDTIFLCTDEVLYQWENEKCQQFPLPEKFEVVASIHGLKKDEIYIATDCGLACFNGKKIIDLESPKIDMYGVRVLSDEQLMVTGGSVLLLWSDDTGWTEIENTTGIDLGFTRAISAFSKGVFIGTLGGVLRYQNNTCKLLNDTFCNTIVSMDDAIIAAGEESYLFDGKTWSRLQLPKVECQDKDK